MKNHPPRLARKVFKLFAGSANVDDLLGDLDEWFYYDLKRQSARKACLHYWKHVISLSFSYALKKRKRDIRMGPYASTSFSIDMIRNYVKVSLRNLYQYKYFSFLNAFGLAVGMSISLLLISLYSYVGTYDNFHANGDNIYTIISTQQTGVEELEYSTAPLVLADKISKEFTGAKDVVRIVKSYNNFVKTGKENIPVKGYYTESGFMSVFSFDMIQGNSSALDTPNKVILTQSLAMKLFNSHDVVGKTIELDGGNTFEVTGLIKDHPNNSHLSFEMLLSYSSIPTSKLPAQDQWISYPRQYVYVLLHEGTSPSKLQDFLDNTSKKTYQQSPVKVSFALQHLHDIVMGPDLRSAIGIKWEASGLWMFGIFAALILLPACFNYANISIARALRRSKEVGLRKTMGGARNQIFFQFLTETVLITLLSLGGSLLIFTVIRSEFQSMMVAGSTLDLSLTWRMMAMFFAFSMITGFAAGVFPAIYFSRMNPMQALKSKITTRGSSMRVRKFLTIGQFALSFGFILSLVVFSRQYRYSVNFDFGFEKRNIVDVNLHDVDGEHFKKVFSQLPAVQSISLSSGLLGVNSSSTWLSNPDKDSIEVSQLFVDANFISSMRLTFLAGENFRDEVTTRERHVIVNEEFLKAHNISNPAEALGRVYAVEGHDLQVIGVLKNFHYAPLHYPIGKFIFRTNPSEFVYANLKVSSNDAFEMFSKMENMWKQLPTEKKFIGKYFEDELNEAYSTYKVLLKIVGFLGILAVTISLLGMLAMVVHTSETKAKEVSIRKVMGATAASLALLLSADYLKMMGWAILFAAPVTGWLTDKLLSKLQYYSVRLTVFDVLFSAMILLTLGVLTIVSQAFKTATSNPADTLRTE